MATEPETDSLASRIREVFDASPRKNFTADDIATVLDEDRGRVANNLPPLTVAGYLVRVNRGVFRKAPSRRRSNGTRPQPEPAKRSSRSRATKRATKRAVEQTTVLDIDDVASVLEFVAEIGNGEYLFNDVEHSQLYVCRAVKMVPLS